MKGGVDAAKTIEEGAPANSGASASASSISVLETLELLESEHKQFAEGVCAGLYVFWLGSGISRERFPTVLDLVEKVLEFIRSKADMGNAACPYRCAMNEALELASASADEITKIDFDASVSDWPILGDLKKRLEDKYETLLGIEVGSEPSDILVWDGIDVAQTYADPNVEPDVTHLCIAALVLEGLATELATANWDGLVEKAVEQLAGNPDALAVCVRSEDLQKIGTRPSLIKFHGCAVRALSDPDQYRALIIGRGAQIADWDNKPETKGINTTLVASIIKHPSLVMGLSIQDFNIKHLFGEAKGKLGWEWPGDRPSYVFSEDKVTPGQKDLLQIAYKTYDENKEAIRKAALVRAYPKQLLLALVLYALTDKLQKMARAKPGLKPALLATWINEGLVALRNFIASQQTGPHLEFAQKFLTELARIRRVTTMGEIHSASSTYTPISSGPVSDANPTPELLTSGLPEAAFAGGIIGKGISDGAWSVEPCAPGANDGALGVIGTDDRKVPLYLANTTVAENALFESGALAPSEDAILLRGLPPYPRYQRSPTRAQVRRGKPGLIEITIAELVTDAKNADDLYDRFRKEAVL